MRRRRVVTARNADVRSCNMCERIVHSNVLCSNPYGQPKPHYSGKTALGLPSFTIAA